jgi:hypothetical protein
LVPVSAERQLFPHSVLQLLLLLILLMGRRALQAYWVL